MLRKIGIFVSKHPWLVVGFILFITIGFGSLLPGLEMQTTMDDFLPEDETVIANRKISEYFGEENVETIMIYIEKNEAKSITSPDSLREMYKVSNNIKNDFKEIVDILSVSGFVDIVCNMEFQKTLDNCSNEQIATAFNDLMEEVDHSEIKMLENDDPNEPFNYNPYPRISKGKNIDSIDLKNYYIQQTKDSLIFTFEVYDLSDFEEELISPAKGLTVYEWFFEFKNLIIPDEALNLTYKISAHVEPKNTLWELGGGFLNNIGGFFEQIRKGELRNSYQKNAMLWISMPDQPISFPIDLETGSVTFNTEENRISVSVSKEELGKYGIAPEIYGFELPARIGNSRAGFRYFQRPVLNLPWNRVTFNFNYLQDRIGKLQNRPLLGSISEKILIRYNNFTWQEFNEIFSMLEENDFIIDAISLKDIESFWTITDLAPDNERASASLFIKPSLFKDLKEGSTAFLSYDKEYTNANVALMIIQIDASLPSDEMTKLIRKIVERIKIYDSEENYVSMRITGGKIIEYEITDVSMAANQIVAPLIFIVISIILFLSFFKISYVLLPLVGLSVSIVWLFGTMVLLRMDFIIINVALIPMIMGLGVDYSVHMFHNYKAEIEKGKTAKESIIASITDIGTAMMLATITTFIAFLSFLTATMAPMRNFGFLCAIGIVYVFIVTITLQAAVRYILDRRKNPDKIKSKHDLNGKIMKKIARVVCIHPKPLVLITVLITVVMIFGATQVKTGFNMEDFLPEENESVQVLNEVMKEFPFASDERENILIEGNVATVQTLRGIRQTIENMKDNKYVMFTADNEPRTYSVLSIINKAVDRNQSLTYVFNLDSDNIPETNSDVKDLFDYLYNKYEFELREVLHKNKNGVYDATLIVVYTHTFSVKDSDLSTVMGDVYNELQNSIAYLDGNTAVITGDNSMIFSIMNSMPESQIISTVICLILAALVLIIVYKKLSLGLIAMIPVCISTVWIVGTMYFIGYSLNVMTIMITSLTIGLGITYAIHAIERFKLVAAKTGDVMESVSETVGHTGGALMIAAVTTIAGFGMLMLTPMQVQQQFGLITALTILFAFLTSIFILPPILMFWGRWQKKKYGYIINSNKNNKKK
jgi:predicted RND superfamily exporter protein